MLFFRTTAARKRYRTIFAELVFSSQCHKVLPSRQLHCDGDAHNEPRALDIRDSVLAMDIRFCCTCTSLFCSYKPITDIGLKIIWYSISRYLLTDINNQQGCRNFNVKNNALISIVKMYNGMQIHYPLLF